MADWYPTVFAFAYGLCGCFALAFFLGFLEEPLDDWPALHTLASVAAAIVWPLPLLVVLILVEISKRVDRG